MVGPRLPGLVVLAAGAVGGLLSLVGEYTQRIYQLGQGIPFYELRDAGQAEEEPARARRGSRE